MSTKECCNVNIDNEEIDIIKDLVYLETATKKSEDDWDLEGD